ncbi:MAG: PD-(D/E)XK nuclease family protein, partial [Chthoniobacteraceae bacterium]
YQEILIDDLSVLATYFARHSKRHHAPALAAALEALPFLPERAPLSKFIERSGEIFHDFGWTFREEELQRLAADWRDALKLTISRHAWLRWLGETLVSWRAERATEGAHPYSRLHLLPYAHAESQAWSHLIVAGLSEGQWPPDLEDSGFIGEEEIADLNGRLRVLNTRAITQGRQGEGHIAVQSGKAFCLGPSQRRALTARQFFNTLESATAAIAVAAQLHDEAAPDRPFNASEFFAQLYFSTRGRAIAQDTMTALHTETARWLDASGLWKSPAPDLAPVQPTRRAHDARRSPGQPFGEYEFALRTPPQPPLRLAAKRWEDALAAPAEVWMKAVLGVSAEDGEDETPWALAQGNWIHDWLRAITGNAAPQTFAPLPPPNEIQTRVRSAANAFRERVSATLASHRRTLPDWWASAWEQALGIATTLAESVAHIEGRTHAAAEWNFDETAVPLADGALRIHGRIDLLLTTSTALEDAWLIDYKTGKRTALKLGDIARGESVQLALYALALRAAGARAVGLSLLAPGIPLDAPQLNVAHLDALDPLWGVLLRMQETGGFGMHGALRNEFGVRRSYPLATLAIDEEILAEKWSLTHPGFADAEEEA